MGPTGPTGRTGPTGPTGIGLTGPTGPAGGGGAAATVAGNYYSDTTQTILDGTSGIYTTPTLFSFNTTFLQTGGVTLAAGTQVTTSVPGNYEIFYTVHVGRSTGTSKETIYIWLRKNGLDIADTNNTIQLGAENLTVHIHGSYFMALSASDYIEVAAVASSSNFQAVAEVPTTLLPLEIPYVPSVIVGLKKI